MVLRHAAAVLTGLLVALGTGLLAGAFAADRSWLHVAVFGLCTAGPAYGLGWLLFVPGTIVLTGVILSGLADLAVRFSGRRRRAA